MSVVGIDFGDQSCYISIARAGGIEVITNDYSQRDTPTCVSFTGVQRFMGVSAMNQVSTNFKNTIHGFKSLLGRKFTDPFCQAEFQNFPIKFIQGPDNEILMEVQYLNENVSFTPEQITAMLFTKIKHICEGFLNSKVVDCVVSVPTYYTDQQRHALLFALKISGLNPLRIINDTTAAALAYGIYHKDLPDQKDPPKVVVIIDIGHLSTQINMAEYQNNKIKVIGSLCRPDFGGRDFTNVLFNYFATDILTKNKMDVRRDTRATIRLLEECKKMKKLLSTNSSLLPLNIECLMNDKDVSSSIDRKIFEELTGDLLKELEKTLLNFLAQLNVEVGSINAVEIIGGSTRIPSIKNLISQLFKQDPKTSLNADEAVSRGCAVQCAILSPTFKVKEIALTDRQMYPISLMWKPVATEDGDIEIFPSYQELPFTKMLTFCRKESFEFEARYSYPNSIPYSSPFIGRFKVVIPENEVIPDESKIKVRVKIDRHGIFGVSGATLHKPKPAEEVNASVETTVEENAQKVENAPPARENTVPPDQNMMENGDVLNSVLPPENSLAGAKPEKPKVARPKTTFISVDLRVERELDNVVLNNSHMDAMIEKENELNENDRLAKDKADAKNAVEEYVYNMRDKLENTPFGEFATQEERDNFKDNLNQTEDWLYGEGENVSISCYHEKGNEISSFGNVMMNREKEYHLRIAELDYFGQSLTLCSKWLNTTYPKEKDSKYSHIAPEEIEKLMKSFQENELWYSTLFNKLNSEQKKCMDPLIMASEIKQKRLEFHSHFNALSNKQPPKVEVPKQKSSDVAEKTSKEISDESMNCDTPITNND